MEDKEQFIGLSDDNSLDTTNSVVEENVPAFETEEEETLNLQSTPSHLIDVHVTDKKTPILLLFGAQSSGKTMTLVRLAKYLKSKGYKLFVDTNFCTSAWEYSENSKKFNEMLGTTRALKGTDRNDFLFIKVTDSKGTPECQILEGAGEDYFPTKSGMVGSKATNPFPPYMADVFAGNNKKVWMFLTEPDWNVKFEDKAEYVDRIEYCKTQYFGDRDKCIILYNKVDKKGFTIGKGKVHIENALQACNQEYPNLFDLFKNHSPLPWSSRYKCKFVPFSTGIYGNAVEGQSAHYTPSNDAYPAKLWETILECIKG